MEYFESKRLREEMEPLAVELQNIGKVKREEKRDTYTAEELERIDKLNEDIKVYEEKIRSAEADEMINSIEVSATPKVYEAHKHERITRQDHENAFRAWSAVASGNDHILRGDWNDSVRKLGVNLNSNSMTFKLSRKPARSVYELERAQTVGTDAQGGYTAQDNLIQGIEKSLLAFDGVRGPSRVIRTANGNVLPWLTVDDTSSTAASHAENTGDVVNTSVTFGKSSLNAYTYTSGVFPVSVELLQDTDIDFSGFIGELLGERLGRTEAGYHTTGTGSSQPQGVVTGSTLGVYVGDTDDPTAVDYYSTVIWLKHAIDPAYRQGSFGYMFNDTTLKYLKLEVDTTGRPLWKASMAVGAPSTIDDSPYWVNPKMADPALDAKFMVAGDFSKFLIRDVGEVVINVLRERYAEQLSVAYIAHHRTDSMVLNSSALKYAIGASASYAQV